MWLQPPETPAVQLSRGSPGWAVVVLLALVVLAALGWRMRRWDVAAISLVAFVAAAGAAVVLGSIPAGNAGIAIAYIQYMLWPVGMFTVLAFGWGAVALLPRSRFRPTPRLRSRVLAGGLAGLALVGVVEAGWEHRTLPTLAGPPTEGFRLVSRLADEVTVLVGEPSEGDRRLAVAYPQRLVDGKMFVNTSLVYTLGYRLRTSGWSPRVADARRMGAVVDPVYWGQPGDPLLVVSDSPPRGARVLGTFVADTGSGGTPQTWSVSILPGEATRGPDTAAFFGGPPLPGQSVPLGSYCGL